MFCQSVTIQLIIAFIASTGIVSTAFAHGGWGVGSYGGHKTGYGNGMGPGMMGYGGYGMGPGMMDYGYGPGNERYDRGYYPADLSREDSNKLQQAQDKFFDETRTLRDQIRDKQFALNEELGNANPDKVKVAELQKSISKLQSDFDQEALDYRLEVRKIMPEGAGGIGNGYGSGYGMGIGMLLFWGLIIFAIVSLISGLFSKRQYPDQPAGQTDDALQILKKRYARGEIDKTEFDTMRRDLDI